MSSPYRRSTSIPNTGDRFDSFDIHVERLIPIIEEHIRQNYGEPDQAWLKTIHKARKRLAEVHEKEYVLPEADFAYFKNAVFRPSLKGIGRHAWKDRKDDPDTRNAAFAKSREMMEYYNISTEEILGTSKPSKFSTDQYTRWPYYAAALALVIERARSTPHEVHVLPDAPDDRREDLQHDPLVYAVSRPGREGREGSDAAHRESAADGQELAGTARPSRRSPGGRKRRWSSAGSRTSGSSSGSGAGAAKQRKP